MARTVARSRGLVLVFQHGKTMGEASRAGTPRAAAATTMRTHLLVLAFATVLFGCGGLTSESSHGSDEPAAEPDTTSPTKPSSPNAETAGSNTSKTTGPSGVVAAECPNPASVVVTAGGTIIPETGSAMRLQLIYQGSSIGVSDLRGVDMTLENSAGPFTPGYNAGYWADVLDASNARLYTRMLQDPTHIEAVGAGGSGWTQLPVDKCEAKRISLDLPNTASAAQIVIYGSPYGTFDAAVEIGRFSIH